jgi:hypothetical protein
VPLSNLSNLSLNVRDLQWGVSNAAPQSYVAWPLLEAFVCDQASLLDDIGGRVFGTRPRWPAIVYADTLRVAVAAAWKQ